MHASQSALAPGGHYAPVNGLNLYYEISGAGPPLVLLHGGLLTIESFAAMLPALAQRHQLIAIEVQGHGHTADIDRPMNLDFLADDVIQLLRQLGIAKADFVGYSLGGLISLHVCRHQPGLVGRMVVASADLRPSHVEFQTPMAPDVVSRLPTAADFQAMRDGYAAVAPDPDHFDALAARTSGMVRAFDGWTDEEIRSVTVPTMLIVGDTDFTPLDNAVAMFNLLPQGQLAVMPGTTHIGVIQRHRQFLALVEPFLE